MGRPDRGGILPRMTGTDTTAPIVGPTEPAPISGRRRAVIWALIVVASLVGLVAIHAMWINEQLLSNSTSSQTSAALIRDAAVRRALSGYIVDQIYSNVDVANEIKQQLPSQLKPLSAPAAAALRDPAVQGVNFLLERPSIQALFVSSASDAHRQLVNVLEDKTGLGVTTGNGTVQINLSQLIRQVGTDLGLPSAAVNKLPPTAGVITVMRSSQLGLAQTGVRAIRIASVWLVVLVLAILALALYLAEGIRRATLRNIGWAFVIVGLVVFVARRIIGDYVVGGLTTSTYEVPAQHAWVIGTSTLGDLGWATVFYGVLIVLGATSPVRRAPRLRYAAGLHRSSTTDPVSRGRGLPSSTSWWSCGAARTRCRRSPASSCLAPSLPPGPTCSVGKRFRSSRTRPSLPNSAHCSRSGRTRAGMGIVAEASVGVGGRSFALYVRRTRPPCRPSRTRCAHRRGVRPREGCRARAVIEGGGPRMDRRHRPGASRAWTTRRTAPAGYHRWGAPRRRRPCRSSPASCSGWLLSSCCSDFTSAPMRMLSQGSSVSSRRRGSVRISDGQAAPALWAVVGAASCLSSSPGDGVVGCRAAAPLTTTLIAWRGGRRRRR